MKRLAVVLILTIAVSMGAFADGISGSVAADTDIAVDTGKVTECIDLILAMGPLTLQLESVTGIDFDDPDSMSQIFQLFVTYKLNDSLTFASNYKTGDLNGDPVGGGTISVTVTWSF